MDGVLYNYEQGNFMLSYDNYIERRKGHSGGYPVLKRMNLSVRVVIEMSRQVAGFGGLCQALPQCTPQELQAALDYYAAHPNVIDQDIKRNRRAWQKMVGGISPD